MLRNLISTYYSLTCLLKLCSSTILTSYNLSFQLLKQESDRIEVVETEFDWWNPLSDSENEFESDKSRAELCVKTERNKTLWSHLSSPEKKKVCELIGYVEGEPNKEKSKQCIGKFSVL